MFNIDWFVAGAWRFLRQTLDFARGFHEQNVAFEA